MENPTSIWQHGIVSFLSLVMPRMSLLPTLILPVKLTEIGHTTRTKTTSFLLNEFSSDYSLISTSRLLNFIASSFLVFYFVNALDNFFRVINAYVIHCLCVICQTGIQSQTYHYLLYI